VIAVDHVPLDDVADAQVDQNAALSAFEQDQGAALSEYARARVHARTVRDRALEALEVPSVHHLRERKSHRDSDGDSHLVDGYIRLSRDDRPS